MVLGTPPAGFVFDQSLDLSAGDRAFGSAAGTKSPESGPPPSIFGIFSAILTKL
jgi:hypothetical protein